MRMLLVCLLAAGVSLQAETYRVSLAQRSEVAGKILEPGDYKLDVEGTMAKFRNGKDAVEVPVRSETGPAVNTHTVIGYDTGGAMYRIVRMELKGTPLLLRF